MNRFHVLLFSFVCIALSGCVVFGRHETIYEVNGEKVEVAEGRNLRSAIFAAAYVKRWVPKDLSDNTVRCTIDARGRQIVVDVLYTGTNTIAISYVSSEGFYDCSWRHSVHPKCNQWIKNLERQIKIEAVR